MKNKLIVIDIGNEFSKNPYGRFTNSGDQSAESLFIILNSLLEDGYILKLDFSNTLHSGSCFIEHLVRLIVSCGYKNKVTIIDDPYEYVKVRWDKYLKLYS